MRENSFLGAQWDVVVINPRSRIFSKLFNMWKPWPWIQKRCLLQASYFFQNYESVTQPSTPHSHSFTLIWDAHLPTTNLLNSNLYDGKHWAEKAPCISTFPTLSMHFFFPCFCMFISKIIYNFSPPFFLLLERKCGVFVAK